MSSVSLSKSVRWPTRADSTWYATRLTGEKIESIGITPIGWSGDLFSSAGEYPRPRPIVRYISSLVFFSSVAMWASGFSSSTPEGRSMSPAVTSPGPLATSGTSISAASECIRATISLRLRTMSVTSSFTPLIVENSCATPWMRTLVTAAPASDESSTRRSGLLRVELDDELLLHRRVDLRTLGVAQHLRRKSVVIGLKPRRHGGRQVGRVSDDRLGLRRRLDGDHVVRLHLIARHVHPAAVDRPVPV